MAQFSVFQSGCRGWFRQIESGFREMGTKSYLRPLDAFSGLLVCPKCASVVDASPGTPLQKLTAFPQVPLLAGRGLSVVFCMGAGAVKSRAKTVGPGTKIKKFLW